MLLTKALARQHVRAIVEAVTNGRLALATNLENELAADFVRFVAEATNADAPRATIVELARVVVSTFDLDFERHYADEELDEEGDEDEDEPSGGPIDTEA